MNVHRFELEELAAHLVGLNYDDVDYSEIEQKLYEKFNIDSDSFNDLVVALLPMIDVGESPLTGTRYKGFSRPEGKHMLWIVKTEISPGAVAAKKKKAPAKP
jgi:hypothetical protein